MSQAMVELRDIDLYLELASQADGIEVGGLLTTRAGDKLHREYGDASYLVYRILP